MSRHNTPDNGFTLVELVIVMALVGIMVSTFYVFFNNSLTQYISLQKDGSNFTDIAYQSQRMANVLRGVTDIVSESANDITCYAYFLPDDTYVSQIHYYKNSTNTQLLADVTPMTANPPIGSLITSKKQTFTIIPNFYQATGVNTFMYLGDSGSVLTLPIADEHSIKGIQVNLATKASNGNNEAVSVQVSLRNRKTNL